MMQSQSPCTQVVCKNEPRGASLEAARTWFASRGWKPFDFQIETWRAYLAGESGLVHAPTGLGKTLAVWMGPLLESVAQGTNGVVGAGQSSAARRGRKSECEPLRVLWITPLRALAADTTESLLEPVRDLGVGWSVQARTGDTSQSIKRKQRDRLPTALVTTPESLSLLLSYSDARAKLSTLRCVIVDEWHELLGTKRGIQTELGLARLRSWNPTVRTWGLSATLGNLEQAAQVLVGGCGTMEMPFEEKPDGPSDMYAEVPRVIGASPARRSIATATNGEECAARDAGASFDHSETVAASAWVSSTCRLITGQQSKVIEIETLIPCDMERFPWSGHIGLKLLPDVLDRIEKAATTLLFTNTRSQTEIWFRAIVQAKPDWLGTVAIHHGSIDHDIRSRVESMLKNGTVRCVVCTSSLDLGVDFSPVDQVIQVGSPKGVARLLQRAGRSGHRPGVPSRIVCVPTHAFELIEFAAARDAVRSRDVESRVPLNQPLDVLVQHLVTVAAGGGFDDREMLHEIRTSHAYRSLTDQEWQWAMDFVSRGGKALTTYPQYARIRSDEADGSTHMPSDGAGIASSPTSSPVLAILAEVARTVVSSNDPRNATGEPQSPRRWTVTSQKIAAMHRLNVGTITSDGMMRVAYVSGRTLGTIEESFIARLKEGDRFVFSGRVVELVRVRDMTAQVQRSKHSRGIVPVWGGGRMPLSSQLAQAVRVKLEEGRCGVYNGPEMLALKPLLDAQRRHSRIPSPDELLVERVATRDGNHFIIFPFHGRLVHEGLAALCAHRVSKLVPISVHATATDYGFDLHTPPNSKNSLNLDAPAIAQLLSEDGLLDDLIASLNTTELARRRFRDIARVAGLIQQGYPGQRKQSRQLQASSEMFYEVFQEFDPANLLLSQARREVLEEQLEVQRLRQTLRRISTMSIVVLDTPSLTPLAFPVWADVLRGVHATSETWSQRVARMSAALEEEASGPVVKVRSSGTRPARVVP